MTGPPLRGLRVGYVLDLYPELSQTFVASEIDELRRLGACVEVIALHRGDREPRPDEPFVHLAHVPGRRTRDYLDFMRLLWWRPIRLLRFLARLRRTESAPFVRKLGRIARELSTARVQRLHAHFAWQGAETASLLAALLGIPWSVTVHARDLFTQDAGVLRGRLRTAKQVVCVSEYNQRWLGEHGMAKRTSVIRCGVRIPEEVPVTANAGEIVAVARLVEKKGIDVLIDAVASLAHRASAPRATIVGDGPERERLQARAMRAGVGERVRFLGALPHEESLEVIDAAGVVCLPSRVAADGDMDGIPISLIEAMARGKPVVATAISGVPELVDDTCGRLVPAEDVAALAGALEEFLAQPEASGAAGQAGRERVRERHDLERQVVALAEQFRH
jgi:glycosyltransferase involved in cell wall biosynthesis